MSDMTATKTQIMDALIEAKDYLLDLNGMLGATDDKYNDIAVDTVIVMSYATIEGYVKRVLSIYLNYVARQRIALTDLCGPLWAACVESVSLEGIPQYLLPFILERPGGGKYTSAYLPIGKLTNTNSNLNSHQYESMVRACGLEYCLESRTFSSEGKTISLKDGLNHLVNNRNKIAHGHKRQKQGAPERYTLNCATELIEVTKSVATIGIEARQYMA